MALISCPECGREISDKAVACPFCGCPNSEFHKEEAINEGPQLLPEEDWPDMFECYKCGRRIPVDTYECPFCRYIYGSWRSGDVSDRPKNWPVKKALKIWCSLPIIICRSEIQQ